MDTLFKKVTANDIQFDPFPHIWILDALDGELCKRLFDEFPPSEVIAKTSDLQSNKRYTLKPFEIMENHQTSNLWKEFILNATSKIFFSTIFRYIRRTNSKNISRFRYSGAERFKGRSKGN